MDSDINECGEREDQSTLRKVPPTSSRNCYVVFLLLLVVVAVVVAVAYITSQ